ncbi:MAG TPA: alpha/beta fold hydrolase [Vicinamibacteria bacterium]|nr:alpha/beta fold hydrolase [Vicinamibacteria bacterium]
MIGSLLAVLLLSTATSLEVRVPGAAGTLGGTLTLPARGRAPFPAVVTLTGSGAHYRDGNRTPEHPYRPFRQIAETLAGCGVATLRLDDRGVGESTGDASAATAEDTAADAEAALTFLRARPEIDPRRLGLVGHSYGGEIAPMVAAGDPTVAAVVLLAGPARTFRETMRYQHRYRIEKDGTIAAADREAALAQAMIQQDANVKASTEAWRRSIQDRDPLPAARRLRMPVLIRQGSTDRAVQPEDAVLLERAVREGGNRRVECHLFPGVNHHFQRDPVGAREGYDRLPTQDLAPEVLETLGAWLRATLR